MGVWIVKTISCVIVIALTLVTAPLAAQDYSTPVDPHFTVVMNADPGHYVRGHLDAMGIGGNFEFTEGDASGTALVRDDNEDGIPDFLSLNFDDLEGSEVNFPWTFVRVGAHHTAGENLEAGTYTDATRDHIFDDLGPVGNSAFDHTECDDLGEFTISEFEYEKNSDGAIHVIAVDLLYTAVCENGDGQVRYDVSYSDAPKGGDTGGGDDGGGPPPPPPPPPPPFQIVFGSDDEPIPTTIGNSGTATVNFRSAVDSTFNSDLHFTVTTDAKEHEDFTATIAPAMLPAPGIGEGEVTVTTGPNTFPRPYQVVVHASDGRKVSSRAFLIDVECTPPTVLGINQPQTVSKKVGEQVHLAVTPNGSGPFVYQWYRGFRGMNRDPIQGAHFDKLDFTATQTGHYWVRVSNACGSVDSNTASVWANGEDPIRRR